MKDKKEKRIIYLRFLTLKEICDKLSRGGIISFGDGYRKIKVEKGTIHIIFGDDSNYDTRIPLDKEFYFECEPFQIKETGIYKTRSGKKAFVSFIKINGENNYPCGVIDGDDSMFEWKENGYYSIEGEPTEYDIIGKWED